MDNSKRWDYSTSYMEAMHFLVVWFTLIETLYPPEPEDGYCSRWKAVFSYERRD